MPGPHVNIGGGGEGCGGEGGGGEGCGGGEGGGEVGGDGGAARMRTGFLNNKVINIPHTFFLFFGMYYYRVDCPPLSLNQVSATVS